MSKAYIPARFESKSGEVIGYANAPVIDRGDAKYRDLIPAETWLKALSEFFATGAPINFLHRPINAGRTKVVRLDENGPLLITTPIKEWVAGSIAAGDIKGYSIEYKLFDFDVLPPVGTDPRPIRQFKSFSLVRVSYVDEPMNPGSYFIGGKSVNLKDYGITFDREGGKVVITAKSEAAMSAVSDYLADGIKASTIHAEIAAHVGVKAADITEAVTYEFKVEADEKVSLRDQIKALGEQIASALSGKGTETPGGETDPVDLKASLDGFLEGLKELGLDATKFDAIEAQIASIKSDLPEGEKSLADTISDLQAKASDTSLADAVAANGEALKALAIVVEKQLGGKATSLIPAGGKKSADQLREERWADGGLES